MPTPSAWLKSIMRRKHHEHHTSQKPRGAEPQHGLPPRPHLRHSLLFHDRHPHEKGQPQGALQDAAGHGTHLSRKTNTTYIFIGQPVGTTQAANTAQSLGLAQSQQDAAVCIQVNDKVVSLDELSAFLQREQRQARKSGEAQQLTVCLKADRHAPMRVVEGVKMALRKANMLHVNYYATEKAPSPAANP